jgi:hypothetical protein
LGARAEEAPTSPPVARRWIIFSSLGSNLGALRYHISIVALDMKMSEPQPELEEPGHKR